MIRMTSSFKNYESKTRSFADIDMLLMVEKDIRRAIYDAIY